MTELTEQVREIAEKERLTTHEIILLNHNKALEAENARYEEALKQYANEENWTSHDEDAMCLDVWIPAHEHGYERAQNAMKGDSNQ